MKAVFDTNILIDYLNGVSKAAEEIDRFDEKAISIITYIEVLVGLDDVAVIEKVKNFLATFQLIGVNQNVADLSITARKKHRLKVPDAIIFGTAQFFGALLVTRNSKDFPPSIPMIRMPYDL